MTAQDRYQRELRRLLNIFRAALGRADRLAEPTGLEHLEMTDDLPPLRAPAREERHDIRSK